MSSEKNNRIVIILLVALVLTIVLRAFLGAVGVNFYSFFDRLFHLGIANDAPFGWALFGLLIGAVYGGFTAWKKYRLKATLNFLPLAALGLFLIVVIAVNGSNASADSGGPALTSTSTDEKSSYYTSPLKNIQFENVSADDQNNISSVLNSYLVAQAENNLTSVGLSNACDYYDYPVPRYFSKKGASRSFVYNDILNYRIKFKFDSWIIEKTSVKKLQNGRYIVDISGDYRYFIKKPKSGGEMAFRNRLVHNRYLINGKYKIVEAYEIKD